MFVFSQSLEVCRVSTRFLRDRCHVCVQSIPGGLPSRYQRAVTQHQKQIDSWQRTVKEARLSREQRKEFQSLVESRFHVSHNSMTHLQHP